MTIKVKSKRHNDVVVTEEVLKRGVLAADKNRHGDLHASGLRVESHPHRALVISFEDQTSVSLPVAMFSEFSELESSQLQKLELGFAGSAITLDDADIHVSIAGLIKASEPMRNVVRAVSASILGSSTSEAKAAAARANGAKGGRPRKGDTTSRPGREVLEKTKGPLFVS